jgi:hypothetical protein
VCVGGGASRTREHPYAAQSHPGDTRLRQPTSSNVVCFPSLLRATGAGTGTSSGTHTGLLMLVRTMSAMESRRYTVMEWNLPTTRGLAHSHGDREDKAQEQFKKTPQISCGGGTQGEQALHTNDTSPQPHRATHSYAQLHTHSHAPPVHGARVHVVVPLV